MVSKEKKPRINQRKVDAALALMTPALVIAVTLIAIPIYFPTNDDSFAQQIFAGSISGEPSPYVTFMGYAWCWLVSTLFAAVPGVAWWTVLHLASIYISLLCIGLATLRALRSLGRDLTRVRSFVVLLVLECGVSVPLIGRLQFTTTGSLAASAAVYVAVLEALLRLRSFSGNARSSTEEPQSYSLLPFPVPILLMTLGCSYRQNCGYLALGFWILAILIIVVTQRKKMALLNMRRACFQLLCGGMVVGALWDVNAVAYSSPEWKSAFARGDAYAGFTDFPTTPYCENPELYEDAGWDEGLYNIASSYWYFLDPRMTTESLRAINEANSWGMGELMEHPLDAIRSRTIEMREPVALAYIAVYGVTIASLLWCMRDRAHRRAVWTVVAATAVLIIYLFLKGRLPLRAFLSVVFPSLAVFGAVALVAFVQSARCDAKDGRRRFVRMTMLILFALLPSAAAICQFGYFSKDCLEQVSRQANIDAFQSYARHNSETLFIYDYWAELTPQTIWDTDWPANAAQWGGWMYIMPWFDDVMRAQGFGGTPTTDSLLRDDVLFVNKDDFTRDLLIEDMKNLYGDGIDIELVNMIGEDLRVYRFTLE